MQLIKGIATLGLAGVLVMTGLGKFSEVKAVAAEAGAKQIVVTGNASIKVKPDIANINLGVMTTNADAKAAQAENSKIMNAVITAVKAQGIKEEDIKTTSYYMHPNYDYSMPEKMGGTQKIDSYNVNSSLSVTVRDINKVGEIIDVAIEAGANSNSNIEFTLSDQTMYYNQALVLALQNASGKANVLAKAVGVTIGLPSKVQENGGYYNSPVAYGMAEAKMSMDARMPVQSGELLVTAAVEVTYEY